MYRIIEAVDPMRLEKLLLATVPCRKHVHDCQIGGSLIPSIFVRTQMTLVLETRDKISGSVWRQVIVSTVLITQ